MITRIIIKYLLILIFTSSNTTLFGQLASFGTHSKRKPLTRYKFAAYSYFDFWREAGIGIQSQIGSKWSIDLSAFYIRPNSFIKTKIRNWEYYNFDGAGISLKPKLYIGITGLYIGMAYSLEYLEHKKIRVAYNASNLNPDLDIYYNEESCYGWASTIGFTVGNKFQNRKLIIEPFYVIGITVASLTGTTYSSTSPYSYGIHYPYQFTSVSPYLCMNFGLKIGFNFKKNKKAERIDSKFDAIYLPRHSALMKYMETIDFKRLEHPKSFKKANSKIKKADKALLKIYLNNYSDTTEMYLKIENYFDEIDNLIEQGKK
ncbi:hypothetical protein [Aurantibacillus circumpalustris]|uniref:hypothetical protein n=1 Tax=Aurantibacillus circumpalustris TaxID=3036359 RepID=UPI00295BDA73|nr:hypothetical protein [Aurantibacillus circumpalustris]